MLGWVTITKSGMVLWVIILFLHEKNGLRLLSIYSKFHFLSHPSYFQQPNCHKTLWLHPRSKEWHLFDSFITKKRDLMDIYSTCSFIITCCISTYALILSRCFIRAAHRRLQKTSVPKRVNTLSLKSSVKQMKSADSWSLVSVLTGLIIILNHHGKLFEINCILVL